MSRALLASLVLAVVFAIATPAHSACRKVGTELMCDLGSTMVTIGTQAVVGYDPAIVQVPFRDMLLPLESSASSDGYRIEIQHFGGPNFFCHRFGNETYCY